MTNPRLIPVFEDEEAARVFAGLAPKVLELEKREYTFINPEGTQCRSLYLVCPASFDAKTSYRMVHDWVVAQRS